MLSDLDQDKTITYSIKSNSINIKNNNRFLFNSYKVSPCSFMDQSSNDNDDDIFMDSFEQDNDKSHEENENN